MKNKETRRNDEVNEIARGPKTSVPMSKDKAEWKRLRESLVEKQSTALTSYPMKVTQLQEITKGLVVEKIKSFLDKLAVIFNEEYIVFKEDGFGWLRNSNRLLPLYDGTEDIVYLTGVRHRDNSIEIKSIQYCDEADFIADKNKLKIYKKRGIELENRINYQSITLIEVELYYSKYNLYISEGNDSVLKKSIIGHNYRKGWHTFEYYSNGSYYCYPYSDTGYSDGNGYAMIPSKSINISKADEVLNYALTEFKIPNHPLMTKWDRKLYTLLEQLYKQDVFTETEETAISNFAIRKEKEKDGEGVFTYSTDEQTVINKLFGQFIPEIESLKTYDDVVNYLDADSQIENAFFNQSLTSLLEVETTRANIQPYEMDILRDVNK